MLREIREHQDISAGALAEISPVLSYISEHRETNCAVCTSACVYGQYEAHKS